MVLRAALTVLCAVFLLPTDSVAGSLEEDVKAAYVAWDAAFNKGDAKAVAGFYTEDATFLPPSHEIIKGPAGVEQFFAGLFANGVSGHQLEMIEANGDADILVAAAKWSAKSKDSAIGGIATHLFTKEADGTLKIKLHTFN
jgi:uncharacterized protein (TIGR02246 family)